MIGPISMPPTITVASGRCTWLPMPVEMRGRQTGRCRPTSVIIRIGRICSSTARNMASAGCHAAAGDPIIAVDDQDAAHHRNAEQRDESDRGRDAEIQPGDIKPQDAAADRERQSEQRQQAVAERIEQPVEQHHDEDERNRQNDGKPLLGLLQPFELAGPIDAIAGRQFHVAADALLRFLDGAGEVAAAYAEFDRHETLVALAENVGGAGIERDDGEVAQRNIGVAVRRLNADLDIAHFVDVVAILRRQPHHHAELAVRLQQRGRDGAAQRGLNDGVDVADVQAVARRLFAIDLDVQIGLPEHPERAEIGDALAPAPSRRMAALRDLLQGRQIGTDDLDRIGAFDARQPFLDIVLDVLREIEVDADEFVGEFGLQVRRSSFSLVSPAGHSSNGFSGTKNSALKNPAASLPSSGRPCCETTVMTSGWRSRISRIRLTIGMPASSEMVGGIDARIHRLPSSSVGRNSLPSREPRKPLTPRKTSPIAIVIGLLSSDQRSTGV